MQRQRKICSAFREGVSQREARTHKYRWKGFWLTILHIPNLKGLIKIVVFLIILWVVLLLMVLLAQRFLEEPRCLYLFSSELVLTADW